MTSLRHDSDAAFVVGYELIGTAVAAFARLLLEECARLGVERLAFVSRDGHLLQQATRILAAERSEWQRIKLDYVYLSRRSTSLCGVRDLSADTIAAVLAILASGTALARIGDYFGFPHHDLLEIGAQVGIAGNAGSLDQNQLEQLVANDAFRCMTAALAFEQSNLVLRYLNGKDLLRPNAALVDAGWRGTIQAAVNRLLLARGHGPLDGYYIGLWNPPSVADSSRRMGLLSDSSRAGSLREQAAWYNAFLLEIACQSFEGGVVGYREHDANVVPVLEDSPVLRRLEQRNAALQRRLQAGALNRVRESAAALAREGDLARLRREVQSLLLRQAFFPSAGARAVGASLVHTEGHAITWCATLLPATPLHPLLEPRRWLAGLANAPWFSAYFMATGGLPLAFAFYIFEAVIRRLPPAWRKGLKTTVVRSSSVPNTTYGSTT